MKQILIFLFALFLVVKAGDSYTENTCQWIKDMTCQMTSQCGFPMSQGNLTSCTSSATGIITAVCTCPNGTIATLPQKDIDSARCMGACRSVAGQCNVVSVNSGCNAAEMTGSCNACGNTITLTAANFAPAGGNGSVVPTVTTKPVVPTSIVPTSTGNVVPTVTTTKSSSQRLFIGWSLVILALCF